MKRYWLFMMDNYYPVGGMRDFVDSFDTVESATDAKDAILCKLHKSIKDKSWHIFDSVNATILAGFDYHVEGNLQPTHINAFANNDL